MKLITAFVSLLAIHSLITSCGSSKKDDAPAASEPGQEAGETADPPPASEDNGPAPGNTPAPAAGNEDPGTVGVYLGFDGSNDFSAILPAYRTYKVADPTIAKVTRESGPLSEAAIDRILGLIQKSRPELDVSSFRDLIPRQISFYRVTALKPGTTTISFGPLQSSGGSVPTGLRLAEEEAPAPAGGTGDYNLPAGVDIVPQGDYVLKVYPYSQAMVDAGKKRYTTKGSGNLRACTSCHAGGEEGAPPHELGRVTKINDTALRTWITTGSLGTREAAIEHRWEFSNAAERQGITAYLRTLQSNDMEKLILLMIENLRKRGF